VARREKVLQAMCGQITAEQKNPGQIEAILMLGWLFFLSKSLMREPKQERAL